MEVLKDKVNDHRKKVAKVLSKKLPWIKICYKRFNRLMKVISTYIDLTTDFILFSTIMNVLVGSFTVAEFETFPFQVALILFVSIVVPISISAIMIAHRRPLVVLSADQARQFTENKNHKKIMIGLIKFAIIFFFPIVPALIILSAEDAKEKRKSLKDKIHRQEDLAKASILEECETLTKHIDETRLALLTFKRNELSMELVMQQSITLIMVLLKETTHPIESGLQSIFYKASDSNTTSTSWLFEMIGIQEIVHHFEIEFNATFWFLVFTVVWSFKTCVSTAINIKTESKNFLPFLPKIILALRYFFIFIIRVGSIVTYFSPFFGLLDIMAHSIAEKISLLPETWFKFNGSIDGHYHYWNEMQKEYQSIHISQIFRSDYLESEQPKPPSTTEYTLINLGVAYILFWVVYLAYAIVTTSIKYSINNDFKSAPLVEKIQHIIEVLNIPEAFQDWDSILYLDVNGHMRKWSKILIEMMVMSLLQVVSNLVMLIPFLITGK